MRQYMIVFALLAFYVKYMDCLHCFNCSHVAEGADCNNVTECNADESCFIERNTSGNATEYSLGCMSLQNCPAEHEFTMVGRSVTTNCKKCCAQDGCNKRFCEPIQRTVPRTTLGTCTDNPTQNCSALKSLVDICSTPHRAKDICRKSCGLCNMVDGSWGDWHDWSVCSTTCDLGVESRTRQCDNPVPAHGGYNCTGNDTEQRSCFSRACPVHGGWSFWASWEACSESCGTGLKKRHRTCTNPPPSLYGHYCLGDPVEYTLCNGSNCGNQSTGGTPVPTNGTNCNDTYSDCDSANKTFGICNDLDKAKKSCAKFCGLCNMVDGAWAVWSHWDPCSTSCGPGTMSRTRNCTNPAPQGGGRTCMGSNRDTRNCTLRDCPVHGGWGSWAHWTTCSSTCDQGITHRTRVCDNPRPQLLGNYCFGDSTEYGMCLIKKCPVNGSWTDWSLWSSCSATCGDGHATRKRYCVNPPPANGGANCTGNSTEQTPCNVTKCADETSAFTVTDAVEGSTPNSIRFTNAVTNVGDDYNISTGVFTCEYPGIYAFVLHIMKHPGSNYNASCYIRRNGHVIVEAMSYPDTGNEGGYYSSSNSALVHLVTADRVDVGDCSSADGILGNFTHTSFSGVLIKAD